MAFTPCNLPPGADGDAGAFFAKVTGFGYNDMISLPTLTKESILENLKRRFKVRLLLRPALRLRLRSTAMRVAQCELVYTYVGDIVVSVNPFKNTGGIGKVLPPRVLSANGQCTASDISATRSTGNSEQIQGRFTLSSPAPYLRAGRSNIQPDGQGFDVTVNPHIG